MHAHALRYCNQLNNLLGDAHTYGKYLSGYCIRMVEKDIFLYVGGADRDEDRGDFTTHLQVDGDVF